MAKKSKYNAKKVIVDGHKFDSKSEAQYYIYLKDRKEKGEVADFTFQPRFTLQEAFTRWDGETIRMVEYVADFLVTYPDGSQEVIDVKGMATSEAKLKRKLYEYRFPIPLTWVVFVLKRGGWLTYEENEKAKRAEKRAQKKIQKT